MNKKIKELILPVKKKWFDMQKSGEKTEEYREIKPFWVRRFLKGKIEDMDELVNYLKTNADANGIIRLYGKQYTHLTLTLGYPSKQLKDMDRYIIKNIKYISIGFGKKEWGAEKGVKYFIIKH